MNMAVSNAASASCLGTALLITSCHDLVFGRKPAWSSILRFRSPPGRCLWEAHGLGQSNSLVLSLKPPCDVESLVRWDVRLIARSLYGFESE